MKAFFDWVICVWCTLYAHLFLIGLCNHRHDTHAIGLVLTAMLYWWAWRWLSDAVEITDRWNNTRPPRGPMRGA